MANYPREIHLDKDTEERLIRYLEDELTNHYMERGTHIDDLLRWQKDYWAKPLTEQPKFPHKHAATIIIPLTAITVEAVHARKMTTFFGQTELVNAKAISPLWDTAAKPVEKFLNRELTDVMKIRKPMGDCFLEADKFGTMIGKTSYEKITKSAVRDMGGVEQKFDVVIKDGAVFSCVPDSRFLMPYSATDVETAPWVGEEHTASAYEVEMMERSGLFRPGTIIDRDIPADQAAGPDDTPKETVDTQSVLRAWVSSSTTGGTTGQEGGNKFDENQERLEHTEPSLPKTIDWVEIWLAFDVDGDGENEEIVCHYHRGARAILSLRYNWNNDLSRPYNTGVYFPVEHRWRGIGICKQNEQFQREITTQHRQRLDNATLANMRMIKIHKLAGYGPNEPVFPGKQWFVDDMTHVESFQLGEIYPSAYNNEQATLIYSQQRTGINDQTLGMQQVGTPGTATAELSRTQEGKAKFDFTYANAREFINSAITKIASNIQQFGPRQIAYFDNAEDGELVRQYFDMPADLISKGLLLTLKSSGQQQNKILDRQNWQQVAAMLTQYYTGLIQMAEPLGNPQLLQLIFTRGMGAATEAMRQILDSFDIRNIDRIVVKELEQMVQQQLSQAMPNGTQRIGAGGGPNFGSSRTQPNAPVDIFASLMRGAGQNGNGESNRVPNTAGSV